MKIPEEFIHFIWQFRLFNQFELFSQAGEPIKIIDVGHPNKNAGPDFLYAKIRIAGTEWVGHVEIHVDGNDWIKHGHVKDPAYNNVVLHVIWDEGEQSFRADGTLIPTFSIHRHVEPTLLYRYQEIIDNLAWIPCEYKLKDVGDLVKVQTLQRTLVERLESRCKLIDELLAAYQGDWERVLFIMLCRSFGMKVNTDAFIVLGRKVDPKLLGKYRNNPEQIEALLFGQAGLLEGDDKEEYRLKLLREYTYLKHVHHLSEMEKVSWRFMRMRPPNFPTFRLAQLSALYTAYPTLFAALTDAKDIATFKAMLTDVKTSLFWQTHFRFGKISSPHGTRLTVSFIEHIIINAFAPILFSYGKLVDNDHFQEKAIQWLESCAAEDNAIVRKFGELGLQPGSAAESQAVLQLKQQYCDLRHCLHCAIGLRLIK